MIANVDIARWDEESFTWTPHIEYRNVELSEYSNSNLFPGPVLYIDLPDGHYNDGTERVRRWTLENPMPDLGLGLRLPRFVGFAAVEVFEKDQTPDFVGYQKQRWTITLVNR